MKYKDKIKLENLNGKKNKKNNENREGLEKWLSNQSSPFKSALCVILC